MYRAFPIDYLPRCELGEGPLWDAETGRLYWVDITGYKIHRWNPQNNVCRTHHVGTYTGFVVIDHQGQMVAGLHDGIYRMEFGLRSRELLARPKEMHPENRFNDGGCDPRGRLWAGTMHFDATRERPPTGALYQLSANGLEAIESRVSISNGLGWDPTGRTMYFSDTHKGIVWAYDYDLATGKASNRRIFVEIPCPTGVPDGLTVDSQGRVFVAVWRASCVNIYDPSGKLDDVITLPVRLPTSCCFGGADLKTLFITTAFHGMLPRQVLRQPLAGYVFTTEMDVPGQPTPRMHVLSKPKV